MAVLHRMVASADVLVENFRPSVPARLGIDYPRLRAINPRLIYAGLTGYGDAGPLSEKGGFDQVMQCLSGMAVFQGGGADRPQLVLGSVLDYFTSALLAYGVAAALFQRERSGRGQYLSLSLLRSALTIQAGRFVWAESEGRDVARDSGTGGLTGIHPTKSGALYISVHSNHFFAALCELIGRPELASDPRCATMRSRAAHAAELVPEVRAALAARTALEWEEIFGERVPCAAVRPIEDMFDHPQVLAEELVTTLDHPVVGRYRTMTKPVKFSDTPGPAPTASPTLASTATRSLRHMATRPPRLPRSVSAALCAELEVRVRTPNEKRLMPLILPLPLREGVGGRGSWAIGTAPSPQPPPARGGGGLATPPGMVARRHPRQ